MPSSGARSREHATERPKRKSSSSRFALSWNKDHYVDLKIPDKSWPLFKRRIAWFCALYRAKLSQVEELAAGQCPSTRECTVSRKIPYIGKLLRWWVRMVYSATDPDGTSNHPLGSLRVAARAVIIRRHGQRKAACWCRQKSEPTTTAMRHSVVSHVESADLARVKAVHAILSMVSPLNCVVYVTTRYISVQLSDPSPSRLGTTQPCLVIRMRVAFEKRIA